LSIWHIVREEGSELEILPKTRALLKRSLEKINDRILILHTQRSGKFCMDNLNLNLVVE